MRHKKHISDKCKSDKCKSDKCKVIDHKLTSQNKEETAYTLEPLESRVLLSADLSGAVQALSATPVETPPPAVILNVTPASTAGQQALSVAELLAIPVSAFPVAVTMSVSETVSPTQTVSQTADIPPQNQVSMPSSDSSLLSQNAESGQSFGQQPTNEQTTPTNTTLTAGPQTLPVAQVLPQPISLSPTVTPNISNAPELATNLPTNANLSDSVTINPAPLAVSAAPESSLSSQTTTVRPPIDTVLLSQWQQQMTTFGQQHANLLSSLSGDAALDATYYDAARVFYQIADYTHDPSWLAPAHEAATIYRDQFVIPSNGDVPGYWNFTGGLLLDYQHTGDVQSKDAITLLANNAAFARDGTPLEWTASTVQSREVAYSIMSYLNAETVGQPHRARLDDLVTQAIGHLDQWFVSKTAPYLQPFMAGLTMEALIQYNTAVGGDSRILPAIQSAADSMWSHNWLPQNQSFQYIDRDLGGAGGPTPASDLNMLIAPAYAWMYHQTGNPMYQQEADAIFKGGVQDAYLDGAKQFNQNYLFAFDFLTWRNS